MRILLFINTIYYLIMNLIVSQYSVNFDEFTPFCDAEKTYVGDLLTTQIPITEASVAFYPFASELYEAICSQEDYLNELHWISTREAYNDLINNTIDIAICSETSSTQQALLDSLSDDILMVPIAKEAIVFYTDKNNPIESLSKDELNLIYSGQIKNWAELGGYNEKVYPFQLENDIGGSEGCFEHIVDNSQVIRDKELIAYDMRNIIDLAATRRGGIGYAFNQFYQKMYYLEYLKTIPIDNVAPTYENISTGNYPLLFNIYFVYRKSNDNDNIEKILEWLRSEEGKQLIIDCGLQPMD